MPTSVEEMSVYVHVLSDDFYFQFYAVRDIEVPSGIEVNVEPGALPRSGPRIPRRFSCRLKVVEPDIASGGSLQPVGHFFATTPQNVARLPAGAQAGLIEGLIGKEVTIDTRATNSSTLSDIVWLIDAVRLIDSLESQTDFDIEIQSTEIIGATPQNFDQGFLPAIETGRIRIPTPAGGDTDESPLGVGNNQCVKAPIKKRKGGLLRSVGGWFSDRGHELGDAISGAARDVADLGERIGLDVDFAADQIRQAAVDIANSVADAAGDVVEFGDSVIDGIKEAPGAIARGTTNLLFGQEQTVGFEVRCPE